jgi:mono/diheme cytochrome c family protein
MESARTGVLTRPFLPLKPSPKQSPDAFNHRIPRIGTFHEGDHMTSPENTSKKSSMKEYAILVLLILIGSPIAWYLGTRDGKALAARAYEADSTAAGAGTVATAAAEADSAAAPESTPESITRGAALFQANCVACHGTAADGKGAAAAAFTPPPRNFLDAAAKWTKGRAPDQIFATVSNGVEGTGMAGFSAALTVDQRWDLVHYIRSLSGVQDAKDAP